MAKRRRYGKSPSAPRNTGMLGERLRVSGIEGSFPDDFAVGRPVLPSSIVSFDATYEAMTDFVKRTGGRLWSLSPTLVNARRDQLAFGLGTVQAAEAELDVLWQRKMLPVSTAEEFSYTQGSALSIKPADSVTGAVGLYRIIAELEGSELTDEHKIIAQALTSIEVNGAPEIELAVWQDQARYGPRAFREAVARAQRPREVLLGAVGTCPLVATELA